MRSEGYCTVLGSFICVSVCLSVCYVFCYHAQQDKKAQEVT